MSKILSRRSILRTLLASIPLYSKWRAISAGGGRPSGTPFEIRRGTNISHWLSQSSRRGEERRSYFTRSDVEFLAGRGFDHLRIPVDEVQLWDESGRPEAEAFDLLDGALEWCLDLGLKVVVDLHILRSHHFDREERPLWTDEGAQERFLQCWRDLSSRMRSRPVESVAYELMNEPVAEDPEDWNRLAARATAVIREREPMRILVIGSNRWQSVETFDRLRVPAEDPNLILSFHFYTPMALTHYRASWNRVGEYTGPVRYPGITVREEDLEGLSEELRRALRSSSRHFDASVMEALLEKPLRKSRETGLALYCGEWGCITSAPREDRLRWYRDLRRILEANRIAWTTWDYKGNFRLRDPDGTPDDELIGILTSG